MSYDWSKFTKRIPIKKNKSEIYKLWSSQKGIESWFLRKSIFYDGKKKIASGKEVKSGYKFKWNWYMYKPAELGTILKAEKDKLFSFTFIGCVVTVTFKTQGKYTIVELTQENIPLDEESKVSIHLGCSNGWTYHLTNLKSFVEHKKDLRNKKIKKVFNN